jgi:uncharacterized protein
MISWVVPLALIVVGYVSAVDACQLCHGGAIRSPLTLNWRRFHFANMDTSSMVPVAQKSTSSTQQLYPLPFTTMNVEEEGAMTMTMSMTARRSILMANFDDATDEQESPPPGQEPSEKQKLDSDAAAMSTAMIASIGFYKKVISPLLPPACRFVPTCSQYGVDAIKEFGPGKGVVLIAWRLLRCSPVGGKGYDPPKWPPVSYTYSSY